MKLLLTLGAIQLCYAIALPLESSDVINTPSSKTVNFPYPVENDLADSSPNIIKVRYGPYSVRANSMANPILFNLKKPCTSECWVTALQGGLEYADGKVANADTGAWLHHMQMNRRGAGKSDLTCRTQPGERIYSVGNEREVSRMNAKAKYGILFKPGDSLSAMPELMNESKKPISVYIIMKYEILQPAQAAGYKEVKMAWLDITGCGISSEPAEKGAYERKQTSPWKSTIEGRLLYATGHVHDGGTKTTIYRTRGGETKEICESHAQYGGHAGYTGADGMEHISKVSYCDFAGADDSLKIGDVLFVGASYNSSAHMLMTSPGSTRLEPIMGISRAYIGT